MDFTSYSYLFYNKNNKIIKAIKDKNYKKIINIAYLNKYYKFFEYYLEKENEDYKILIIENLINNKKIKDNYIKKLIDINSINIRRINYTLFENNRIELAKYYIKLIDFENCQQFDIIDILLNLININEFDLFNYIITKYNKELNVVNTLSLFYKPKYFNLDQLKFIYEKFNIDFLYNLIKNNNTCYMNIINIEFLELILPDEQYFTNITYDYREFIISLIYWHNYEITKYLLNKFKNFQYINNLFLSAIKKGDKDIVKLLLDYDIDEYIKAINIAKEKGNKEIIELITNHINN